MIVASFNTFRFRSTIGILGPACSDTVEPSLEFRNTSRLLSLATGLRSIEVSIIQSFPDHDNLNLILLIIMTTSAEGSISNSKSQADFPYFFRTIAENKQYK